MVRVLRLGCRSRNLPWARRCLSREWPVRPHQVRLAANMAASTGLMKLMSAKFRQSAKFRRSANIRDGAALLSPTSCARPVFRTVIEAVRKLLDPRAIGGSIRLVLWSTAHGFLSCNVVFQIIG